MLIRRRDLLLNSDEQSEQRSVIVTLTPQGCENTGGYVAFCLDPIVDHFRGPVLKAHSGPKTAV